MSIHQTAIVDTQAEIDPTAEIGPFAIIEGPVRIGPRTRVYPHAYINGWTEIGADCSIHPGAVVGHLPQDLAYEGGESFCRVGEGTVIREGASIHRGTDPGSETVVGRRCFIMANAHVAHNCRVGDQVKMANGAVLGGHVQVGDQAFLSGNLAVHQFVRIGEYAMLSGLSKITMDIPPGFTAAWDSECVGVNTVGLRRAGFGHQERQEVKQAYRILYNSGHSFDGALEQLAAAMTTPLGRRILEFLREPSKRGIAGGRKDRRPGGAIPADRESDASDV